MLVVNYEQLLRAVFSCFRGHFFYLHCRVRTKKLLDTKVRKKNKKFGKYFWGFKNWFFKASCFGFILKGVCLLLFPLVFLAPMAIEKIEILLAVLELRHCQSSQFIPRKWANLSLIKLNLNHYCFVMTYYKFITQH